MKKILILALLFMGCDYAPTEHSHDRDVVEDRDDSSYELLAWAFRDDGLTCLRVGENQCTNYEYNGGFDEPLVTVDVQEIRIYDGERYNDASQNYFVVEVTYVNGTVVKIFDVMQFGYLEN